MNKLILLGALLISSFTQISLAENEMYCPGQVRCLNGHCYPTDGSTDFAYTAEQTPPKNGSYYFQEVRPTHIQVNKTNYANCIYRNSLGQKPAWVYLTATNGAIVEVPIDYITGNWQYLYYNKFECVSSQPEDCPFYLK